MVLVGGFNDGKRVEWDGRSPYIRIPYVQQMDIGDSYLPSTPVHFDTYIPTLLRGHYREFWFGKLEEMSVDDAMEKLLEGYPKHVSG